ncbi:adhesive plaque matrix protein-like [Plutella xylostella]|uniref:adhesive plaque matrix protein-like n=1 Tax=Plutella xylostella TaxID=51655 RepID=UPI002032FA40|nr:adhesive plaque matrix protein-like [Plutella xylostella]
MWSLAVLGILLVTADGYSYQRASYAPSGNQINRPQYSQAPQYHNSYAPGHAYIEKSQYQVQHGGQPASQYAVQTLSPAASPGHTYIEKSQYQITHGPQAISSNQFSQNVQINSPAPSYSYSQYPVQPANNVYKVNAAASPGHAYVEKSQYQVLLGGQQAAPAYTQQAYAYGAVSQARPAYSTVSQAVPVYNTVSQSSPVYQPVSQARPIYNTVSQVSPVYQQVSQARPVYNAVSHASPVYNTISHSAPLYNTASQTNLVYSPSNSPSPAYNTASASSSVYNAATQVSSANTVQQQVQYSQVAQAPSPQVNYVQAQPAAQAPRHTYVEKSHYEVALGGPVTHHVDEHHHASEGHAPGHAYVEKSRYQVVIGGESANAHVHSHTQSAGHEYIEKSQYEVQHGAQASSDSYQNVQLHNNVQTGQIQLSQSLLPAQDGTSFLKPYEQTELTKSHEIHSYDALPKVQPVVSKHVYFHVPPADIEEQPKSPQYLPPAPPAKKDYKIIFIKAPSQETNNNAALIQQQLQNQLAAKTEEKTLIYVLSKKPEPQPPIIQQLPAPTEPSKPEVYYVKYKKNSQLQDIVSKISDQK